MTQDTVRIMALEERVKKLEFKVEHITRERDYWQLVAKSYYEMGVRFINGFERIMTDSVRGPTP